MNAIEFMCQRSSVGYHGILCHIPTYVSERNWSYICTLPMDGHFVRYQEVKSQTTTTLSRSDWNDVADESECPGGPATYLPTYQSATR